MMHLLFLVWVMFAAPVAAQETGEVIKVDKAACRYVTRHKPDADVAYKPGVDVHGNPVAPADITPRHNLRIEDSMHLRLTLNAARSFGLKVPTIPTITPTTPTAPATPATPATPDNNTNGPTVNDELVAGYITFNDGKAFLNNVPLDDTGLGQLAVMCKAHYKQQRKLHEKEKVATQPAEPVARPATMALPNPPAKAQ